MKNNKLPAYDLLEDQEALAAFYEQNKDVEWLCFDTEFIGERRYVTLLCLIQVATEHGLYLIDAIKIKDLSLFCQLMEDENILKITHAGENDYRLLNRLFGTIPKNTFDTQIAAGFVGYKYPAAFRRIVEGETKVRLAKGFAVTDWEARPFTDKQIKYALDDVIYLRRLYESLMGKGDKNGRASWIMDECRLMESADFYHQDPNREALSGSLIRNLRFKEQIFLLRLFAWRNEEAKRKDNSRDMVLQKKLIAPIVKAVPAGRAAILDNRRIPERIARRHVDLFMRMYKEPPTEEEQEVLKRIPQENEEDPAKNIMTEMLHLIIRNKCLQEDISVNLVMPRSIIRDMKQDPEFFEPILETTWRHEFFGQQLLEWLKNRNKLRMYFEDGNFRIEPEED